MGEDVSVVEVIKGGDNVNHSPSSHVNDSAHGRWLGKGCPLLYIWLTGQQRIGWGGSTSISGIGRMCRAWRWRIETWGCGA